MIDLRGIIQSLSTYGASGEKQVRETEDLLIKSLPRLLEVMPEYDPECGPSKRYQAAQILYPALKNLREAQTDLGIDPDPEVAKLMHLAGVL